MKMEKIFSHITKLYVLLQAVVFVAISFPIYATQTTAPEHEEVSTAASSSQASTLLTNLSQLATIAGSSDPLTNGEALTTRFAAGSIQSWLNQFGTARVQLNIDKDGHWDNSAIDLLAPLYDNKKALLFIQPGLRAPDDRLTGNIGAGVRTFYLEDWMFGANIFLDDDFTGKNRRVGIGAEAWTNYLKISANTYAGTTQWHQSRDFSDYEEKPADGFDIRTEGYLPAWPQLGAKIMYEQYYGDNVALFDTDHLQHNPSAITVGLNYTPIPLITAGVDYKRGQDSMDDLTFGINFRYNIGQAWSEQISPAGVALQRSLAGSRYDLVERNNEIVLQYRKKEQAEVLADLQISNLKDSSPADGITANIVSVKAISNKGAPLPGTVINWSVTGSALLNNASSVTDADGNATVSITNKSAQLVVVQATSGAITRSTNSSFTPSVSTLELRITKNNSLADGVDQNIGVLTAKDANGQVLSGVTSKWQLNNGAVFTSTDAVTNAQGQATVHFTNNSPGTVLLSAASDGKTASASSAFISSATVATVTVVMTTDNASAGGAAANVAEATLLDSSGKPVANATVNWATTGTAIPSGATSVTNGEGKASMNFTDVQPEAGLAVNASSNGQSGSTTMTFTEAPVGTLTVEMTKDGSIADGVTANVAQATMLDSNGKPVANATVNWATTGKAQTVGTTSSVTNVEGKASMNFTDAQPEASLTVTASSNGQSGNTTMTFVEVPVAAIAVEMTKDGSIADGVAANIAQATVTDSAGNKMKGITVNWSVTGTAVPASPTSITDENGLATMNYTDTAVESGLTVSATSGGISGSTLTSFIAAPVKTVAVIMTTDNALAGGTATNVAEATVTDSTGKPVANATVNWSVTGHSTPSEATSVTDESGVAIMSFTDNDAEKGLTVTAETAGKSGSAKTSFSEPLGAVTVTYPGAFSVINISAARAGLKINVAWPNMAVGDQVTVNFAVTGKLSPNSSNLVLPDHTFAVYTVAASDLGNSAITFTVPSDEVLGLQPDEESGGTLTGTATATVDRPSTHESQSGSVEKPLDTD